MANEEQARPDPDTLLAELAPQNPGFLKVFVGYAAGVGKSFAMLQAANVALLQGRDVLVGWIEPHARPDTLLLLAGMEALPYREVPGNPPLRELDLEACLKRRPEVLLVDELAHTNAPGSRHEKRWQDVEELLASGIEVWTTVNIQHLESMNDVVARVTGIRVRETVPDRIFDGAREVEVVDVDPEDLIDRLIQGKIYSKDQAERALGSFFKKENLLALRELTLRRAAERVGREVDSARTRGRVETIWPVRERLMVSVGPSPMSEDLLRHAARLARSLDAQLLAVYIETPTHKVLAPAAHKQLQKNLAVAEALGAETVILQGEEVARDLVAYARKRNVTKLVLGKNRGPRLWFRQTIGDELLRISGDIDVYVLSGRQSQFPPESAVRRSLRWGHIGWSTLITAGYTGLAVLLGSWGLAEANVVLVLLLGVVTTAALFGFGEIIYASVLGVLAFNFFFTEPRFSLAVYNAQYYLVFFFMLVVGLVIGTLTQRLKRGVLAGRDREQRMEALNRLNRELAGLVDVSGVQSVAEGSLTEILGRSVRLFIQEDGDWTAAGLTANDRALLSWVFEHGQKAGRGTSTLRDHQLTVWPLSGTEAVLGVLALDPVSQGTIQRPDEDELIESLAAAVSSAFERVSLVVRLQSQALAVENERTRSTILQSLSHDLRTPLAAIAGSAETLGASTSGHLSATEAALLATISDESRWLSRQVENLLRFSRLTAQGVLENLVWLPADEPALSAVERFRAVHPEIEVKVEIGEAPIIRGEPSLIETALANYLENAFEHAGGIGMAVSLIRENGTLVYAVDDHGPGVPDAEKAEIFSPFQRGRGTAGESRHVGLGLAIVRAVADLHGGSCGVIDVSPRGSRFFLRIPLSQEAP
jgi:two-component system sensor histidine kinase KdpD